MATATKVCKVCGREYPYCKTERKVAGVFRWQDVACCAEHGNIYLERVLASRSKTMVDEDNNSKIDVIPAEDRDNKATTTPKSRRPRKTATKSVK